MAQLEIYLTGEEMDRLFICKAKEGKHNLTANEYAQALLVRELHIHIRYVPVVKKKALPTSGRSLTSNV